MSHGLDAAEGDFEEPGGTSRNLDGPARALLFLKA